MLVLVYIKWRISPCNKSSIGAIMASSIQFFLFLTVLFLMSFKYCSSSSAGAAPALFILGDSAVDVGNNNYLPLCIAKANFPLNGIDFPSGTPTGRFSNGKNAADFLAEKLNLPSSPPYLSLILKDIDTTFLTGVNFASGGSGIFNATGESLGTVIHMTEQVDNYRAVYDVMVKKMGSNGAQKYLSKSIFAIVIGGNDLLNYFKSEEIRMKNTPQQYADSAIFNLKAQIQRLYGSGARKFMVTGVPVLGCAPSQRIKSESEECHEELNALSIKYNAGLKSMMQNLKTEHIDINYTFFDMYSAFQNIIQKPAAYGFAEVKAACCGIGRLNADLPCLPISTLCPNRSDHVYWDRVHPTQATSRILADIVYDDPSRYTSPMNMRQLVAV